MQINPLLSHINPSTFLTDYLRASGINNTDEYLHPTKANFDSPWNYPNMSRAIDSMEKFIKTVEEFDDVPHTIGILVDSDADGMLSGAMIAHFLQHHLHAAEHYVIYHHKAKAHGLRKNIDEDLVEQILADNIEYLIIPDAGSNDVDECMELSDHGVEVLILDHHEIESSNPYAIVVNHHLREGLNTALSGTGVTYKFVQALADRRGIRLKPFEYIDMVAVSLISDICDLTSLENRAFIEYGLSNITNPLLKLMCDKLNRRGNNPDGWSWGTVPPINALCRSDYAEGKIEFFNALRGYTDIERGLYWARKAHRDQTELVKNMTAEIWPTINNDHNITYAFTNDLNKSYIGLVANKILGEFGKPTMLLREANPTRWSGSIRSPIPIATKINNTRLAKCMGHQEACGIFVSKANLDKLVAWFDTLDLSARPPINVTAALQPYEITTKLCTDVENNKILWGHGLTLPTFYVKMIVEPHEVQVFRKKTNTVKITKDGVDFLKFTVPDNKVEDFLYKKYQLEAVVSLKTNEWNSVVSPQAEILQYEMSPIVDNENDWMEDF